MVPSFATSLFYALFLLTLVLISLLMISLLQAEKLNCTYFICQLICECTALLLSSSILCNTIDIQLSYALTANTEDTIAQQYAIQRTNIFIPNMDKMNIIVLVGNTESLGERLKHNYIPPPLATSWTQKGCFYRPWIAFI